MVAQVADHVDEMVAEIRVSIETGIILIKNTNLLRNGF